MIFLIRRNTEKKYPEFWKIIRSKQFLFADSLIFAPQNSLKEVSNYADYRF